MDKGYYVHDSKITFSIGYNKSFIDQVKLIKGRSYEPESKTWSILISQENSIQIKSLIKDFGLSKVDYTEDKIKHISYTPLLEKYKKESENLLNDKSLKRFSLTPRKYQIEGVACLRNVDSIICGDDIGIGKTAQAILTIELDNLFPCLIVCPSSVKIGWERQWKMWYENRTIEIINSSEKPKFKSQITIVNYDMLSKRGSKDPRFPEYLKKKWKCIVFDESHYLKNIKSLRTKMAKKISKNISKKIMLTGNAITNRPIELYAQLSILGIFNNVFGNYRSYTERFCNAKMTRWGMDTSGASNTDELYKILSSSCYYHRDKLDVLKDLPELQSHLLDLDIDNSKEYLSAESDLILYLKNEYGIKRAEKAFQAEHLVLLNTLRQLSQRGKINGVIEWLEDNIDQLNKVVVFGIFTQGLEKLYQHFKDRSVIVYGKTKDKQYEVDKFISNDKINFFFGNIESMGTGVDGLQRVCSNCCYIDIPLVPSKMDQATGRLWRSEQKNFVNEFIFIDHSTIDGRIYGQILEPKRLITNAVNKGLFVESSDDSLKKLISSYL